MEVDMSAESIRCDHRCRNACAMLAQGLKQEETQIAYYESLLKQCDEPEIRKFTSEILSLHRDLASRIAERLNRIKTTAGVLDDIISSYEL